MALKHRLADASYWIYDRMRHKTAFDSAAPAEEALDHHYGRTRRIYDKLMVDERGMVYLALAPAARPPDRLG